MLDFQTTIGLNYGYKISKIKNEIIKTLSYSKNNIQLAQDNINNNKLFTKSISFISDINNIYQVVLGNSFIGIYNEKPVFLVYFIRHSDVFIENSFNLLRNALINIVKDMSYTGSISVFPNKSQSNSLIEASIGDLTNNDVVKNIIGFSKELLFYMQGKINSTQVMKTTKLDKDAKLSSIIIDNNNIDDSYLNTIIKIVGG